MKHNAVYVSLVAILLHGVGLAAYVHRMEADLTILAGVSQHRAARFPVYSQITSPLGEHGYDGSFYYALSHAPFAKYGAEIDFPAGRQLRIFFPLICYAVSFGQDAWLIYVLPAVNLFMIGLLTFLGATWCRLHGLNEWYGLTFPFVVNAIMPALRDLTDTTAMAMACWFLYASYRRHSIAVVGLAAVASILAREQNLAILAMVALYFMWNREWCRVAAISVAIGIWIGWVVWLKQLYEVAPFLPTKGNFALPFEGVYLAYEYMRGDISLISDRAWNRLLMSAGMIACMAGLMAFFLCRHWDRWRERMPLVALSSTLFLFALPIRKSVYFQIFPAVALIYLLLLVSLTLLFTFRLRRESLLPLGMAWGGVALATLGGPLLYEDYWSWGRAFFWLPMGVWLLAVQAQWRTLLSWSGLVAYIPLAMVLNR